MARPKPYLPDAGIERAGILGAFGVDYKGDFVAPLPQACRQLREEALRAAARKRGEIEQKSQGSPRIGRHARSLSRDLNKTRIRLEPVSHQRLYTGWTLAVRSGPE